MQLVGFNLLKISAKRAFEYKKGQINTNIEFNDISEENLEILKDAKVLKISFIFSITYADEEKKDEDIAEVTFEGHMLFSVTEDEFREITKSWKKKQIPDKFRIPLINFIIKKCSTKALSLEDELNLPFHIPFPQVRSEAQQPKQ